MFLSLDVLEFSRYLTYRRYTANLASFFTLQASQRSVSSLNDAMGAGWRFCILRSNMRDAQGRYPGLPDSLFVVDPLELGGDGKSLYRFEPSTIWSFAN